MMSILPASNRCREPLRWQVLLSPRTGARHEAAQTGPPRQSTRPENLQRFHLVIEGKGSLIAKNTF